MIVQCTQCDARYRFDETKMTGDSAVVRCRRCQGAFAVSRPDPSLPGSAPTHTPASAAVTLAPGGGTGERGPEDPGSSVARWKTAPSRDVSVRTALLADEARELRDFVEAELRGAGYEVSVTDNGEEALLLAGSHRFDLIILNAYLRRLLGINVCQRIKSEPSLKHARVILLGSQLGPEVGSSSSRNRYGADDFILTSVSREELAARISGPAPREAAAHAAPAAPSPLPPAPPAESRQVSQAPNEDESEIRRLSRIMISDIEIYHPEKFARALREGTFFEAFSTELTHGKEMIDRRFGHLGNRIQILAAGLRDAIEAYRNGGSRRRATGG